MIGNHTQPEVRFVFLSPCQSHAFYVNEQPCFVSICGEFCSRTLEYAGVGEKHVRRAVSDA